MNTTVKAIFISIGSLFTALFLIFAIGMCTPGFRQAMFRVWNVVPNEQYVEKANSESSLTEELRTCNAELAQLTSEKETLLAQVATLDATNEGQAEQIADYEAQIAHLDNQIATLEQRITTITARVTNGTISHVRTNYNIDMPFYDDNGNFMYQGGYGSNDDTNIWYRNGEIVLQEFNDFYGNADVRTITALQNNYSVRVRINEEYQVMLDGGTYSFMGSIPTGNYRLASDAAVSEVITFNGQTVDANDFASLIELNREYGTTFEFEYELGANNRITNLVYTFNVFNA